MSSIRTLLLTAPTLADVLHLHAYLVQNADTTKVSAKTLRRWDQAAFFRVAEFIREATTPNEVIAILNSTYTNVQYAAPADWKDDLQVLARQRIADLESCASPSAL